MKLNILISILIILTNCTERNQTRPVEKRIKYFDSLQQQNLRLLDSFHLMEYNDTAKWLLYAIHCNDSVKYGRGRDRVTLSRTPLGFLDITLTYVEMNEDTLSLLYNFLYNDSTIVEQLTSQKSLIDGIEFNTKNQKIIGYIKGDATIWGNGVGSIYENPLQIETIKFIKDNNEKLNLWFRKEAKRKGIIE